MLLCVRSVRVRYAQQPMAHVSTAPSLSSLRYDFYCVCTHGPGPLNRQGQLDACARLKPPVSADKERSRVHDKRQLFGRLNQRGRDNNDNNNDIKMITIDIETRPLPPPRSRWCSVTARMWTRPATKCDIILDPVERVIVDALNSYGNARRLTYGRQRIERR